MGELHNIGLKPNTPIEWAINIATMPAGYAMGVVGSVVKMLDEYVGRPLDKALKDILGNDDEGRD
ncbi:MAG: hypothetical protein CSB28_02295, partial [Desulfobacterales bacterium]